MSYEIEHTRWTIHKWGLPRNYEYNGRSVLKDGKIVYRRMGAELVYVDERPEKGWARVTISEFSGNRGLVFEFKPEQRGVGLIIARACDWIERKVS